MLENLRVADPGLDEAAAGALLERVALTPELLSRDAAELSGGEGQRMGLARSLATRPRVVLADEPTASLDAASALQLEQLLRGLADDGVDVLLVSHDDAQVERIADRRVALREGRLDPAGNIGS